MSNIIIFSNYLRPLAIKLRFAFIVMARFIKIFFRFRWKLQKINLDYSTDYLFRNSYLLVNYNFRNALWYNFVGIKKTADKEILVFDLQNINPRIILKVHGFFQTETYYLNAIPKSILDNKTFYTSFSNLKLTQNFSPEFFLIPAFISLKPLQSKIIFDPAIAFFKNIFRFHHKGNSVFETADLLPKCQNKGVIQR